MKAPPPPLLSFSSVELLHALGRASAEKGAHGHATVQRVHARKSSVLSLTHFQPRGLVSLRPFLSLFSISSPSRCTAFNHLCLLSHFPRFSSSGSSFILLLPPPPRHSFTAFVSHPFLFLLCLYLPYSTSGFARLLVLFISFSASLSERSGGSDKFHKRHGRCRDGAKAQRDYPL